MFYLLSPTFKSFHWNFVFLKVFPKNSAYEMKFSLQFCNHRLSIIQRVLKLKFSIFFLVAKSSPNYVRVLYSAQTSKTLWNGKPNEKIHFPPTLGWDFSTNTQTQIGFIMMGEKLIDFHQHHVHVPVRTCAVRRHVSTQRREREMRRKCQQ